MTSPITLFSDFKGKFKIPNDDDKILRILVKNPNLGKSTKCKRDIFLYEEGVLINHSLDEIISSPTYQLEYDGEDTIISDEEIINMFHSDDVEYI